MPYIILGIYMPINQRIIKNAYQIIHKVCLNKKIRIRYSQKNSSNCQSLQNTINTFLYLTYKTDQTTHGDTLS